MPSETLTSTENQDLEKIKAFHDCIFRFMIEGLIILELSLYQTFKQEGIFFNPFQVRCRQVTFELFKKIYQ